MVGKKKLEEIDLDEILLREVASRRSPSGSVLNDPTAQTDKTDSANRTEENVQQEVKGAATEQRPPQPAKPRLVKSEPSSYERLFLCEHVVQQRSAIYISSKTKEKLSDVVRRLGWSRISVTSFAENILAHHLELFRDEINRLHRQKNTKDIL